MYCSEAEEESKSVKLGEVSPEQLAHTTHSRLPSLAYQGPLMMGPWPSLKEKQHWPILRNHRVQKRIQDQDPKKRDSNENTWYKWQNFKQFCSLY